MFTLFDKGVLAPLDKGGVPEGRGICRKVQNQFGASQRNN